VLNIGDKLFSIFSNPLSNHLRQLTQAIAQLYQCYLLRFFRIYAIKPKPKPPWVIGKFYQFYFMRFFGYIDLYADPDMIF